MESTEEKHKRLAYNTQVYRERHPDRVPIMRRKTYLNRRRKVFEIIGGAICCRCGCDDIECLEINHRHGGGSKDLKIIGNHLADLILQGKRPPSDYEVLCRVCNALDHLERKHPHIKGQFRIDFTGKKAELIKDLIG